jgi:hypothetical protein
MIKKKRTKPEIKALKEKYKNWAEEKTRKYSFLIQTIDDWHPCILNPETGDLDLVRVSVSGYCGWDFIYNNKNESYLAVTIYGDDDDGMERFYPVYSLEEAEQKYDELVAWVKTWTAPLLKEELRSWGFRSV